jgi:hypothetical protein
MTPRDSRGTSDDHPDVRYRRISTKQPGETTLEVIGVWLISVEVEVTRRDPKALRVGDGLSQGVVVPAA